MNPMQLRRRLVRALLATMLRARARGTRQQTAGMTPFRSEKNTSWEDAYRVPCMVRFPGKIKAG
jgi:arylsulfatase A-like enzyme